MPLSFGDVRDALVETVANGADFRALNVQAFDSDTGRSIQGTAFYVGDCQLTDLETEKLGTIQLDYDELYEVDLWIEVAQSGASQKMLDDQAIAVSRALWRWVAQNPALGLNTASQCIYSAQITGHDIARLIGIEQHGRMAVVRMTLEVFAPTRFDE